MKLEWRINSPKIYLQKMKKKEKYSHLSRVERNHSFPNLANERHNIPIWVLFLKIAGHILQSPRTTNHFREFLSELKINQRKYTMAMRATRNYENENFEKIRDVS